VDLVKVIHLMCTRADYPFLNLESALASIKIHFALGQEPAPVPSKSLNNEGNSDNGKDSEANEDDDETDEDDSKDFQIEA
jgi:hypothetical protein